MAKISKKEYEILKGLEDQRKWIARDSSGDHGGNLFAYSEKPLKSYDVRGWVYVDWFRLIDNHLFQFIQWEDSEPYNVQELIEEYESEETEVKKDIEGLETEPSQNYPHDEVIEKEIVLGILSQLDELGVLSPDWIGDNVEYAYYMTPRGTYSSAKAVIDPGKLQNLLVPTLSEMQKVQLSQKMADELNRYRELGYSLKDLLVIAGSKQAQEKLARAWLDGFTVEAEQKYYVLNKTRNSAILVRMFDEPTLDPAPITEIDEADQFTEQEIKEYDERYIPFMVPVDEVNND